MGHCLPRPQGPPGLRGSNDCTSPLPDAVHQVGVQVQEDDVAVVHHRHQVPAHPPATSPESSSKLLGAGHKGLRLSSVLLGTSSGPDAVVPVTESWDRGQHVQVTGRGHLLRALDLQDPKDRMNGECQGWKMPQSPWKPWAYTPGGWRACSPWRQLGHPTLGCAGFPSCIFPVQLGPASSPSFLLLHQGCKPPALLPNSLLFLPLSLCSCCSLDHFGGASLSLNPPIFLKREVSRSP